MAEIEMTQEQFERLLKVSGYIKIWVSPEGVAIHPDELRMNGNRFAEIFRAKEEMRKQVRANEK